MKKIIVLFSFFCQTVFGQSLGINISAPLTFPLGANSEIIGTSFVPGVGISATYYKNLKTNFAFVLEAGYSNFNYSIESRNNSAENFVKSRVSNNMFHIALFVEKSIVLNKIKPFVRLGGQLSTLKVGGTSSLVSSSTSNINGTENVNDIVVSTNSSTIFNSRIDNRTFGVSPRIDFGFFGKQDSKLRSWGITASLFPVFHVPQYSMIYRFNEDLGTELSPSTVLISELKLSYLINK